MIINGPELLEQVKDVQSCQFNFRNSFGTTNFLIAVFNKYGKGRFEVHEDGANSNLLFVSIKKEVYSAAEFQQRLKSVSLSKNSEPVLHGLDFGSLDPNYNDQDTTAINLFYTPINNKCNEKPSAFPRDRFSCEWEYFFVSTILHFCDKM